MEALSFLMLVGAGLLVVVGILWIFLPFSIFGFQGLLKELIKEQRETNKLLRGTR